MPVMKVTTKSARNTWTSPDGKIKLYELTLEYNGQPVTAKTYSGAIATEGWTGEIETYEKAGKNGIETFVKQPPREDAGGYNNSGNGSAASKPAYQPRDDASIKAQFSIKAAVNASFLPVDASTDQIKVYLENVELLATEFFNMVDRVKDQTEKLDTVAEVTDAPVDLSVVDQIFAAPLTVSTPNEELPWPNPS